MFKKNDPLVNSVQKIMQENALIRQVTEALNEELGIASKKALPFEHHANYDALLEQRLAEAKEGSTPRNAREAKLAAMHGDPKKITHGDVLKARGVVEQNVIQQKSGNPIPPTTMQRVQGEPGEKAPKFGPQTGSTNQVSDSDRKELNKKVGEINEISRDLATRYIKKAKASTRDAYYGDDVKYMGKRSKGVDLALLKKWGDKENEPKVKATNEETIEESAPKGAKYERMIKHIKAKYAKDGLTKNEKSIAYATAWKAKNKEEMKEDVDLNSVLEEIRANLGEEAFNALMEAGPESGSTATGMKNLQNAARERIEAAKAKARAEAQEKATQTATQSDAAARSRGAEAEVRSNYAPADQRTGNSAAERAKAVDKTVMQAGAKNLPADAAQSGEAITKQIANASRPASTAPNLNTSVASKLPLFATKSSSGGQTSRVTPMKLDADKSQSDVGSPANLGAAGGQTASTSKSAAPMPPVRPANLGGNRPAPNAAPASSTNAASASADRGDAAMRIQNSFIDRNK